MHEKHELVGDTGIEPVASSVWGKRSPTELIAPIFLHKWLFLLNIFIWSFIWSLQSYLKSTTCSLISRFCIWSFSNPCLYSSLLYLVQRTTNLYLKFFQSMLKFTPGHVARQQNSIKSTGETLLHFFSILKSILSKAWWQDLLARDTPPRWPTFQSPLLQQQLSILKTTEACGRMPWGWKL